VPGKTQKVHPEKRPKSKSPIKATNDKRSDSICKRIFSPENGVTLHSEQYNALTEKLNSKRDFYYNEWCRLKAETCITTNCTNCSELQHKLCKGAIVTGTAASKS
jgi:hypothetical protein